jgi:3-hydroxyacyl-[acyl-carrier-protein] dehydratase
MSALDFLPHGPEFRFVDRVIELSAGERGVAEYKVRGDEAFLRGHFPGQPLVPGVILVEAGAQLAGIVAQSDPGRTPLQDLKLTAIRGVKILGSAVPGEMIRIEANVSGRMGGLIQASISISVGGKIVVQGDVTLSGR